jgi:threonine dehydratase
VQCPESRSIASGLSPPFAGENAFNHIKKFVRAIILIKEDEIKATVSSAFKRGLVVEPSGAAALAAVLTGKVTNKN